ncbi:MAG: Polyamine aminopropyltransferase [Syntrophomonadaceae bacterium]|nr:Polyamine aminopropyltransferase [Bacillota bacterium]
MTSPVWKWFVEYTHPTQAHMHGVERFVYCGKTPFQDVEIADIPVYGRCLILDGKIQSAEYDEYIYHEALVHPAMVLHPAPRKILVVGGGEGAMLREILRHPPVEQIIMVDIDKQVVELCQQYLPAWHQGSFANPKVNCLYLDARRYLQETTETFDLIFMDLTEPLEAGPSYLLFTKQFYRTVADRLCEGGIVALQAGSFNPRLIYCHAAICNTLETAFSLVRSYAAYIPSYDGAWGFALASQRQDPLRLSVAEVDKRLRERGISNLRFYDGESHQGIFSLPKDVRMAKLAEQRIIEDDLPLITY